MTQNNIQDDNCRLISIGYHYLNFNFWGDHSFSILIASNEVAAYTRNIFNFNTYFFGTIYDERAQIHTGIYVFHIFLFTTHGHKFILMLSIHQFL